ncbi:MAG: methionyl-tRNA formyltransferase [Clostridiales Family XIII bacterium]|jgi:methionyl-tRNA formyltransferase|nr:methionyl-tRNA formyltransferase [Clostridiales Family XIII bacterium]
MSDTPRILYMGTPDFAVPALEALCAQGYHVVSVVTQPDRQRGRGHKLAPSPVKAKAVELGLPVLQPESLRSGREWEEAIAKAAPDLIVVCAYGKILPKETLETPSLGCVNIHASLLPKYRGAAPIHRAVEAGERETGVTLMFMSEGLDEGDMIAVRTLPISGMNAGEVTGALAHLGAELLMDELQGIMAGASSREPQDGSAATYAPPVAKEEGHIVFSADADAVCRKILAMTPTPGAYAFLGGDKIKIVKAQVTAGFRAGNADVGTGHPAPGTVLETDDGTIIVATGQGGAIAITMLQSPGGRPLCAADWLRGHKIAHGTIIE